MSIYIDTKFVRLISSRLRNFKQKKSELFEFSCPFCGDSQKKTTKARGYVFRKGDSLIFSCRNCGYSTSIGGLVEKVDPYLYKEYLMERYSDNEYQIVRPKVVYNIPIPKFGKVNKENYEYSFSVSDLSSDHLCKRYVIYRKIPEKFHNKLLYTHNFKKFADNVFPDHGKDINEEERMIIPFFNEFNELIAVSGRALRKGKDVVRYITLRKEETENKLIYGMDRLDKTKPIKIVEGPIDSLFLDNCLASSDANLGMVAKSLIDMGISKEKITLIPDREPRNKEIVKFLEKNIKDHFNVVIWPDSIVGKDINDMVLSGVSLDDLENIIRDNTFSNIRATLRFNCWKKV